jgi:PPK2 family polyphosphate:nucleotide phosphotransferase
VAKKKEKDKKEKKKRRKGRFGPEQVASTEPSDEPRSGPELDGDLSALLRVGPPLALADIDPASTPGFERGDAQAGREALAAMGDQMAGLQQMLYAQGRTGGHRRLLLVLQGMDTSGKGGVVRRVVDLMDPQGVAVTAFASPTEQERSHDFLWRVERALPGPGLVGVFDRSHYEDVLVGRVRRLADESELDRRHEAINDFERRLLDSGCAVVKCILHISKDEQRQRLLDRLADPTEHWKYDPADVDERARWDDYQRAYELVLERNSTASAPFHVVPADAMWYRDWAVARLLLESLRAMDLQWPAVHFNVHAEMARVQAS